MANNQRNKTNAAETISPANFPLGSVASRAAARAIVEKSVRDNGSQKGDVLIPLEATDWPDRHREIVQVLGGRGRLKSRPKRIAGIPLMWIALPEGCGPEMLMEPPAPTPSVPEGTLRILAIDGIDLPFIWPLLTRSEQKGLLGEELPGPCWEKRLLAVGG